MLRFKQLEHFTGAVIDGSWDASELRDMNAVAFVRGARDDLMEEHYLIVPFLNGDVEIANARQLIFKIGELMVMRREERAATNLVVDVFDDAPRQRKTVVRTRAAPDFVENHEALRRRGIENAG